MKISFIDLKAQQQKILPQVQARIQNVLQHGQYILGPEVRELEEKLADYVGAKHTITCASGTDALLMVLLAQGIGPGDAVFTTPFTFIATAEVISLLGATPIFVDIDSKTFNIDPEKLTEAIITTKKTNELIPRAIIPVDLFGLPADYDPIMEIAKEQNLFVLADAAQSFGATYKGRLVGTLGHATATSFFPAKPLGCYGDGGAIFTDDKILADKLFSIRVHGKGTDKYDNIRIGLNARLDTIQAAILLAKLEIFNDEIKTRQQVAEEYSEALSGVKNNLTTPFLPDNCTSAWAQYSLLSFNRNNIQENLKQTGIPTVIYYPKPLHLQTAFAKLAYRQGDLPVSEKISTNIFSIPMHPYLEEMQIRFITDAILKHSVQQ